MLGGLSATLLVLVTTVAVLLDGDALVRRGRRLVPPTRRDGADAVGRIVYRSIARYFAGSITVALLNGTVILTSGLILGIPLAPLAGIWAAITNLIPQIGGFLGGSFFVLLAFSASPLKGVIALCIFLAYQQLENHVIQPTIIGRAVHLTPPTTMLAALIGGAAAGVPGALVATPLDRCGQVGLARRRRRRQRRRRRRAGRRRRPPPNHVRVALSETRSSENLTQTWIGQDSGDARAASTPLSPKDATTHTSAANAARDLGFDPDDFERASRGLIAQHPTGVIDGPFGPAWDCNRYAFIEQGSDNPTTVNPSLWRQAQLNNIHGLFEVDDGLWQARGLRHLEHHVHRRRRRVDHHRPADRRGDGAGAVSRSPTSTSASGPSPP